MDPTVSLTTLTVFSKASNLLSMSSSGSLAFDKEQVDFQNDIQSIPIPQGLLIIIQIDSAPFQFNFNSYAYMNSKLIYKYDNVIGTWLEAYSSPDFWKTIKKWSKNAKT